MPFVIERNDLAKMHVDTVIVAANEHLQITGGVGKAVADVAGFDRVQKACNIIGYCPVGHAVSTPGFGLYANQIVHAVGPVWQDGSHGEIDLLRSAYQEALSMVSEDARSIALPLISAGTYGFPATVSLSVAREAIHEFLETHDVEIHLVLFGRESVSAGIAEYQNIAQYIDDHYVDTHSYENSRRRFEARQTQESSFLRSFGSFDIENGSMPSVSGAPKAPGAPGLPLASKAPGAPGSAASGFPSEAGKPEGPQQPAQQPKRRLISRLKERLSGVFDAEKEPPEDAEKNYSREEDYSEGEPEASFCSEIREPAMPQNSAWSEQQRVSGHYYSTPATKAPEALSLNDLLNSLDESFQVTLFALIDAKGLTDTQVYKRANMSRQLFSKIRSDDYYKPTKKTALALAVALELTLEETEDLLQRAGYALSSSSKADVIVEYFILKGNYNIFEINEALYAFDQPLL